MKSTKGKINVKVTYKSSSEEECRKAVTAAVKRYIAAELKKALSVK